MAKIVRNSQRISGWGEQHVKSLLYQILCGLLYMQVFDNIESSLLEW